MFRAVQDEETIDQSQSDNEPGTGSDASGNSSASSCAGDDEDDVNGELSKEEQMRLHQAMLDVITEFTKAHKIKEHEYYGVNQK